MKTKTVPQCFGAAALLFAGLSLASSLPASGMTSERSLTASKMTTERLGIFISARSPQTDVTCAAIGTESSPITVRIEGWGSLQEKIIYDFKKSEDKTDYVLSLETMTQDITTEFTKDGASKGKKRLELSGGEKEIESAIAKFKNDCENVASAEEENASEKLISKRKEKAEITAATLLNAVQKNVKKPTLGM